MTSVLYDVAGPRARARNLAIGVLAAAGIVALVVYVVVRFEQTGQFEAVKWRQLRLRPVQDELLRGLWFTLKAAALAAGLATAFGAVFAVARLSDYRVFRWPATVVVELFRAIPLLILIFFFYYGPLQYGRPLPTLWALVFGLTLYNGSVLAEIFRAGILSVPRGQSEAAYALGLRKLETMRSVLLPQAVRAMLPSIVSQIVVLLKDTALGFIITYPELLSVGKQVGGRLAYGLPYLPTYLVIAAVYIGICSILSVVAHRLERWARRSPKVVGPAAPPTDVAVESTL